MAAKDIRMKVCAEVFGSMLSIKLNAWEERFQAKILEARREELAHVWDVFITSAYNIFLLWLAPCVVSVVTIVCYAKVCEECNL